jgi:hypothetical protein
LAVGEVVLVLVFGCDLAQPAKAATTIADAATTAAGIMWAQKAVTLSMLTNMP